MFDELENANETFYFCSSTNIYLIQADMDARLPRLLIERCKAE
jgi:hypothetical protein